MAARSSLNSFLPAGEGERLQGLLDQAELLLSSDVQQAEILLHEAVTRAQQLGDIAREAQATLLLGAVSSIRSQFSQAIELLQRAKDLAEAADDDSTLARILNNLGICTVALGEYGRGMEYYQKSLELARALDDRRGQTRVLNNIGLIYTELGDYPLALTTYQDIRALSHDGSRSMEMIHFSATINTVRLYEHLGRFSEALELAYSLLNQIQEPEHLQYQVGLRLWMLPCLIKTCQATLAVEQIAILLPLAERWGNQQYLVRARLFHGKALMELGQFAEARSSLEEALRGAQAHGILPLQQQALAYLSEFHASQQNWSTAYELVIESHKLDQTLRDESLQRKAQILGVQMQLEFVRQEAEIERRRTKELTHANAKLEKVQHQLTHRTLHDELTGLANRAHFQVEVERALEEGSPFAVLFIDLDRFKQVNDTLGHEIGDLLIKEVSQCLQQLVRSGDLVARMGGDEFTVLLRNLREVQDAELVAYKILSRLTQPIHVREHTLYVTASIGVAASPRDGQDVATLQKNADIAMYYAKRKGRNGVQTFQPEMGAETAERVAIEKDLRSALAEQELLLHYQAKFITQSGELAGFEALVRWQHPEQGLLFPGKFIDVAEESGLILPLGDWVLHEACRQAALWGANARGLTMSVNVSAVQFVQLDFLQTVQAALDASGLWPQRLVLELTESVLLDNHELALQQLAGLKAMGVQLALDDFGTGYSSLGMLKNLHFDILKIDPSFVRDEKMESGRTRVMVEFLISMAHRLDMKVTAEGVETEQQYAVLRELQCDKVQGFFFARPEPVEVAERRLR